MNAFDPDVRYFFSSPQGDVSVSDQMLRRPFVVRPLETHPFLTLGDFLNAIRDFLCREEGRPLGELMGHFGASPVSPESIRQIVIRYEKYGTLYQIASAQIAAAGVVKKFAVIAAQTPEARESLKRECAFFDHLNDKYPFGLIPRIYFRKKVHAGRTSTQRETFEMALSNWFEGYHEWHFFRGKRTGQEYHHLGHGQRMAGDRVECDRRNRFQGCGDIDALL